MRYAVPIVTAAVATLLTGCSNAPTQPTQPTQSAAPAALSVTSSAFQKGGKIPDKYTCNGAGASLPVSWQGAPAGTGWFALYMEDPTASDFTHWYVVDIPAGTTAVAEGQAPSGHVVAHYFPPCPGPGNTDDYVIRVYAMPKDYAPAKLGNSYVVDADGLKAHALAVGSIDGTVFKSA